jgi:hypothetical protein
MRFKHLLSISLICVFGTGCRLYDNFIRTTIGEPLHFSSRWDEKWSQVRFRRMARSALHQSHALARAELDNYRVEPFSVDEQCGFEDGFVDFLEAGGTGNAPPLPPRRYWKAKYQTPDGRRAVEDWFRGYEHGAIAAQASGYRGLVTVPLADAIVSTTQPFYPGQIRTVGLTEDIIAPSGIEADDGRRPDVVHRLPGPKRLPPISDRGHQPSD